MFPGRFGVLRGNLMLHAEVFISIGIHGEVSPLVQDAGAGQAADPEAFMLNPAVVQQGNAGFPDFRQIFFGQDRVLVSEAQKGRGGFRAAAEKRQHVS